MKNYTLFILALAFVFACSSPQNKEKGNAENQSKVDTLAEKGYYGEVITPGNYITGEELFTRMKDRDSLATKVKATITENCQKSGCWMDLDVGNGEVMKVTFKDYGFFVPLDSRGKTAIVEGMARKEMVPVDILKHYAEDAGKSQEEIEAITEPQMALTFEAHGVIIKD